MCLQAVPPCTLYSVHNFTETNFSTELILVQKRPCTKSYENKFRPKISCYTVCIAVLLIPSTSESNFFTEIDIEGK